MPRFCFFLAVIACAFPASGAQSTIDAVLRRHCIACHGGQETMGNVNLKKALSERPLVRKADLWRRVIRQIEGGNMPPKGEPQIQPNQKRQLLQALDQGVNQFDFTTMRDPGYESIRRLTNREYAHTVRDLLGIDADAARGFKPDEAGKSGFDNSGNTLFLQPAQLERYLSAADRVVEEAFASDKARRGLLLGIEEGGLAEAERVLRRFQLRAFRRPPTEQEAADALADFQAVTRGRGRRAFADGIKRAMKNTMVAPRFLMHVEGPPSSDTEAYPIDAWSLASRLSYFFWASMPDDELLELAASGKLLEPPVLHRQIDRLLDDPRAETLGTALASQWLGFNLVGVRNRPDPIDNPQFTDSLFEAIKAESSLYFVFLLRENRPLSEMIDSNYTFVNAELARHYGWNGVKGARMRRVILDDPKKIRGGMISHAGILMVTSFPERTSPVHRGKWLLSDLLGTPPPPPPPNAGVIADEIAEREELSLRQKMVLHRNKASCRSCHEKIDPLGLALENYSSRGKWRHADARGQLPNGTAFEGPAGLKSVLVEQRLDDLLRQITQKMLSYALGRQLEYYDEGAVIQITHAVKKDDYRMRTLVRQIATSYPFLNKKVRIETDRRSR